MENKIFRSIKKATAVLACSAIVAGSGIIGGDIDGRHLYPIRCQLLEGLQSVLTACRHAQGVPLG